MKDSLAKLKRSISATTPPPCDDCMQRYRCAVEKLACYDFALYTQSTHTMPRLKERRVAEKWIYDHIFSLDDLYEISDSDSLVIGQSYGSAKPLTADVSSTNANTLGRDAGASNSPGVAKAAPLAALTAGPSYSEP